MKEKTASICDKKFALRRWTKEGRCVAGTCSLSWLKIGDGCIQDVSISKNYQLN